MLTITTLFNLEKVAIFIARITEILFQTKTEKSFLDELAAQSKRDYDLVDKKAPGYQAIQQRKNLWSHLEDMVSQKYSMFYYYSVLRTYVNVVWVMTVLGCILGIGLYVMNQYFEVLVSSYRGYMVLWLLVLACVLMLSGLYQEAQKHKYDIRESFIRRKDIFSKVKHDLMHEAARLENEQKLLFGKREELQNLSEAGIRELVTQQIFSERVSKDVSPEIVGMLSGSQTIAIWNKVSPRFLQEVTEAIQITEQKISLNNQDIELLDKYLGTAS